MITRLRGELLEVEGDRVVVEAHGVGYEVFMPQSFIVELTPIGSQISLLIRQIFREDAVTLYGFLDPLQRRLFDLLKEVKGCGSRISLALIGELGEEGVISGISQQDQRRLTQASGVGPRLAERIIVELKDKIAQEAFLAKCSVLGKSTPRPMEPEDEIVEALTSLGYRRYDAELAAASARGQGSTLQEQIKLALRNLKR